MRSRATLRVVISVTLGLGAACSEREVDGGRVAKPRAPEIAADESATGEAAAADPAAATTRPGCTRVPFAASVDLAEASGAVFVDDGKAPFLLVVGDSGTRGAFAILDPDTGEVRERGKLPLGDGASDDLEGLSFRDGTFYGITSSGHVRHWRRDASGFVLVEPAYAIADVSTGLVCRSSQKTNCGPNYEGLCLEAKAGAGACAGFAVSKAEGTLRCLVADDRGRLRADTERSIEVGPKESLTGCHLDPDTGDVLVGANMFAANSLWRVTGWRDPGTAKVEHVAAAGVGFPEATAAAPGGVVYRLSDTAGSPSLLSKYRCR